MSGKIKYCKSSVLRYLCGRIFCDIINSLVLIISLCLGILFLCIPASKTWGESADSFFSRMKTDLGGHVKARGSVSWPDDETLFGVVGTDPYYDGNVEGRVKSKLLFGERGYVETHYEMVLSGGDTRRKTKDLEGLFPQFQNGGFKVGRPINDDRRFMDLTWTIDEQKGHVLYHRLDRLHMMLQSEWGIVDIGRQAVTWGNGLLFNPMDLFNPFSPSDIERDYKIGDDLVSMQFSSEKVGDFQFLYVPRRSPATDNVEWDQSSVAGKLHIIRNTTEFDIMFAWHYDNPVIGLGSRGYLGEAAWRLDGVWSFMDDDSNRRDGYLTLVANVDYSWVWWNNNFYGFLEFYLNTLCGNDYGHELGEKDITDRLDRGELFTLGRTYLSGHIRWEAHPLLNISMTVINNASDPSGMLQPRAVWDVKQNVQVTVGGNVTYGTKETEYGGFTMPGTNFMQKTPDSVFLWLTYYF
jgi:hypothetical protein